MVVHPAAASEAGEVGVILISPEGRAVDPQQVSKTVNHFREAELDSLGTGSTFDLQYRTPGFVFKTNAVLGQPYLRGVGSDLISAGAEASVATFMDGIYLPRAFDSIVDFYDLERVEVIKGPQGVHLGRNVVGGAVSIHTRDPEPFKTAYADVLYGSYDKRQLRGAVNLPLGSPGLVLRLAGTVNARDGYSENIYLNEDADDERALGLRGKLLWAPSSDLRLLLGINHISENSSRALAAHPDPEQGINGGILLGGTVPDDPRQITANLSPKIDVLSNRYTARLNWKNRLGELVSSTAWLDERGSVALDLDGTEVDFSSNHPWADSRVFMQEFRLQSEEAAVLSWVAGLHFLHEDTRQALDIRLPLSGMRRVPDGTVGNISYAAFGQIAWRFRDRWRAKAGLRYSYDRRKIDLVETVTTSAGSAVNTQRETRDWEAVTPELVVEYSASSDRLYYASVARGYKAGGFNTSTVQPAFDPEYLLAYEAGLKSAWRDGRVLFNAALFYYDYQDMQLQALAPDAPVGTFPIVTNAAKSRVQGADLEVRYRPKWNYGVTLAATLLDARFEEFVTVDPNNPGDDPDRAGKPLPQAPDVSLNLMADYGWMTDFGRFTLNAGYRYQSEMYFSIYADPAVRQPAYGLFDAGLDFQDRKGRWYASLYVRNITDELYAQNIFRNDPLLGVKRYWGPPRTLGLRVGYRS